MTNFDPPEPPDYCKHGIDTAYDCPECEEELYSEKWDNDRKERDD